MSLNRALIRMGYTLGARDRTNWDRIVATWEDPRPLPAYHDVMAVCDAIRIEDEERAQAIETDEARARQVMEAWKAGLPVPVADARWAMAWIMERQGLG